MLLGMGPWTIFQIAAWVVISVLAGLIGKLSKEPNVLVMASFSAMCGYLFGVIVSLEKVITMGLVGGIAYYIAGLSFDTLHAVGNFVFYPLCYYPLKQILIKNSAAKN